MDRNEEKAARGTRYKAWVGERCRGGGGWGLEAESSQGQRRLLRRREAGCGHGDSGGSAVVEGTEHRVPRPHTAHVLDRTALWLRERPCAL